MVRLLDPTAGSIVFDGREIANLSQSQLRPLRREMQIIFQDPYSSLNPRKSVGQIVGEPFTIHKTERDVKPPRPGAPRPRRPLPGARATATRTSSRAVSASGSASPARSRCSRS